MPSGLMNRPSQYGGYGPGIQSGSQSGTSGYGNGGLSGNSANPQLSGNSGNPQAPTKYYRNGQAGTAGNMPSGTPINSFASNASNWGSDISNAVTGAGNKAGVGNSGAATQNATANTAMNDENTAATGIINTQQTAGNTYVGGLQNAGQQLVNGTGVNASAYQTAQGQALAAAEQPNNATEQGVQNMYNQQAQGITTAGLADYGVLSALGSQATANTIGESGVPMTGGQISALQGQNLNQASNQFNTAQGQANSLRQQGLQAGINQSNQVYQDTNNTNSQIFNANQNATDQQYNVQAGNAGAAYGVANTVAGEQLQNVANIYGGIAGNATAQAQADAAKNASTLGAVSNVTGAAAGGAASGVGAAYGKSVFGDGSTAATTGDQTGAYTGADASSGADGLGDIASDAGDLGELALTGPSQGYQPGASVAQTSPYGQQLQSNGQPVQAGTYNPSAYNTRNQYGNYT